MALTNDDQKDRLKEIGNKPVSQLTFEDKELLYDDYVRKFKDDFGWALDYAEETNQLEDLMTEAKCLVFDVEDKGIDIGGMD